MRVWKPGCGFAAACACLAVAGGLPVDAQTTPTAAPFQNQFPDPLQYRAPVPELPELHLAQATEIPLRGPLLSGPALVDGLIEIRTSGGLARAPWNGGDGKPELDPSAPPPAPADELLWALSPDATHRAKPAGEAQLLVQKACAGCESGWRRGWRLRVAGLAQVPPVVTERRVYYGAADNQVYAVKRKNGHRVWSTPLDGRVLRPIALWIDPQGPSEKGEPPAAALLVIPEPGAELIVLDTLGGRRSTRYRMQKEGDHLVGAALSTPDGYVVLARQGYTPEDASLIVLKVLQNSTKPGATGESARRDIIPRP